MSDPVYSIGVTEVYAECGGMDARYNLRGPGTGFGIHAGTLSPHMTFADEAGAKAAAACANAAYRQGYADAQRDVCRVLGLS